MSDRNAQNGKADVPAIKARPSPDLRYLARTSPPIPDVLIQEAHKLIEADEANPSADANSGRVTGAHSRAVISGRL